MKKIAACCLSLLLVVEPAFAGSALTLRDLNLPPSFPQEWDYYEITSIEKSEGHPGFLVFHVTSSHADYEVEDLSELKKLLNEIKVIELIKRDEAGSGFVDGAVDSVKATGEGFVNLVSHPIDSAKGIGRAAGALGRSIGGAFRKKEEGEKASFNETLTGSSERDIAKKLGVDVYTTNPYLKELLHKMAAARMGGKGAALVVSFLIPVSALVSVTVTASGINSAADQFVNDTSRADLFRSNREALERLGFSSGEINDLLNLSFYTPREATYLRFYLETLKDVKGCRDILNTARRQESFNGAHKILHEAQLAADAKSNAKSESEFENIQVFEEGMALFGRGRLLFLAAYDYLESSALGERALRRASSVQRNFGLGPVEIWNGGEVTGGFTRSALLHGIKVRPWALFTDGES